MRVLNDHDVVIVINGLDCVGSTGSIEQELAIAAVHITLKGGAATIPSGSERVIERHITTRIFTSPSTDNGREGHCKEKQWDAGVKGDVGG